MNSDLSSAASSIGSGASPSRRMPGGSSDTAPRVSETHPSALATAAAMWLGSSSSPTTVVVRCFFLNTISPSAPRRANLRSACHQFAPSVLDHRRRAIYLQWREHGLVVHEVWQAVSAVAGVAERQSALAVDVDAAV